MSDGEQEELRVARVRAECARELAEEAERKYQELKRKAVHKLEEDLGKDVVEASPEPAPNPAHKRARVEDATVANPERPPASITAAGLRKLPSKLTDAKALVEIYTPPADRRDSADLRAKRLGLDSHDEVIELIEKVARELELQLSFCVRRGHTRSIRTEPVTLDIHLNTPDGRLQVTVRHTYAPKSYGALVKTRTYLDVYLDGIEKEVASIALNPDDWFFESYQRTRNGVPRGHPYKTFAPQTLNDGDPHSKFLGYLAYAFDPYFLVDNHHADSLCKRLDLPQLKRFRHRPN